MQIYLEISCNKPYRTIWVGFGFGLDFFRNGDFSLSCLLVETFVFLMCKREIGFF